MTRIAFLTCHLTGTGHLVRTLALARAAAAAGAEVTVVSGGRPLPHLDAGGLRLVQLPPVTVPDFDFSTLRRPDGTVADMAYLGERRAALTEAMEALRPDALVTELFPLGRRILAAEFEHAIAEARRVNPAVAILSSVRDIPEPPRKPGRVEEAAERLRRHYDALLVHGDPDLVPLSAIWPLAGFADRTHYTGYVADPAIAGTPPRGETVLVSVGGGVLGRHLLEIAAKAARRSGRRWHLLVGGADASDVARELGARHAAPNLVVEPPRADYRSLLAGAAASVSLAGYNTVLDLAQCETPAILVPFEERDEKEQAIRAAALARFPGITVLGAATLTAGTLAAAAETAAHSPRRPPLPIRRDGAEATARLILDSITARQT